MITFHGQVLGGVFCPLEVVTDDPAEVGSRLLISVTDCDIHNPTPEVFDLPVTME